jgi:hypothetical protein
VSNRQSGNQKIEQSHIFPVGTQLPTPAYLALNTTKTLHKGVVTPEASRSHRLSLSG